MRKFRIKRPSPALVIAILALFMAGSGGAYAASKITTSQIQNSAITTSKIAKHAVNTGKLKKEAVGSAKLKDEAVTTDKLGDGSTTKSKLADSSVGAKQFGNTITRNATTTVAPNTTGTATALCQTGEKVIGGGYSTPDMTTTSVWLTQESVLDSAQNGWRVKGFKLGGAAIQLTVTAYCLEV